MTGVDKSLETALAEVAAITPARLVLSGPIGGEYRKINVRRVQGGFLAEKLTDTQAFHESLGLESLTGFLAAAMGLDGGFRQLNAWGEDGMEYGVKLTKSGKVLTNGRKGTPHPRLGEAHNRKKSYLIPEGTNVPPLVDMGVFTKEGEIVAAMYDKYRQINRFLEIVDDVYAKRPPQDGVIRIMDFGCGKSYLTFLLYHYFTRVLGVKAEMLGLDLKEDVIAACNGAAERYGYTGLTFQKGDISGWAGSFRADALISLHACDIATDYALYHAIKNNIQTIFAVPCCQHELNAQMQIQSLKLFGRYGVLKERTAALLTDAIRGNLLAWAGYKTQILEFIDFEHTPKNLMIRAEKSHIPLEKREGAYGEVMAVVNEFGVEPMLLKLLS